MILDVNTSGLIAYTDRLESMRSTLLPTAIRNTLNDVAFNTKRRVPAIAAQEFTIRNKSLFKSFIFVNKVTSRNINLMQSEVGIFNRNSKTADGLAKQETGGVSERGLIQMDTARVSNNIAKKVKASNYLNRISLPKSKKKGSGTGFVMIQKGGKGTLFKTNKNKKGQKLTPVYSFMKNRRIQIKKKPFISTAAQLEARRIESIYIKNVQHLMRRR